MTKQLFVEDSGLSFRIVGSPAVFEAIDQTSKHMLLKGVPATVVDELNGNNRKYTAKEMKRAIAKAKKEGAFASRKLLCSANDHPEESFVPPASASHVITNAYIKEHEGKNILYNDWLIFDTTSGKNLQSLVKAGASFGTSIRGLGQLNEDTKEVENYDFLGCDAVGNPSAGTFASSEKFEVSVESAPATLINQVKESLEEDNDLTDEDVEILVAAEHELDELSRNALQSYIKQRIRKEPRFPTSVLSDPEKKRKALRKIQNYRTGLDRAHSRLGRESKTMPSEFNLQEKIVEFKETHFKDGKAPSPVTPEIMSSLTTLQREAVENAVDTAELEALYDELFGEAVATPPKANGNANGHGGGDRGSNTNIDRDLQNRTARELEATQNLAVHLQAQVKELEEHREQMKKEIAAYEKVAVALYEQVEEIATESDSSKTIDSKLLTRKAVSAIRSLQKEAHDVIKSLETRLESAIRIGDVAMETAITLRKIADSLYARQVKLVDEDSKTFIRSKTMLMAYYPSI